MNSTELGKIFGLLMKYREINGNPVDRPLREGELSVAITLFNSSQSDLESLDDFLETQGYTLYIRNLIEFGIPPKQNRPNMIYVITRKRGSELAQYLNSGWFIEEMVDRRTSVTKEELVFWVTRLWLTMQWFFYQRIDRMPQDIGGYLDAFISTSLLIETVSQGIERLGNEGKPDGDAGFMWEALWKGKGSVKTYVPRFITVMETAGMIQKTNQEGEYRQTLLAAVEMAAIAENELAYLMPPDTEESINTRAIELLTGESNQEGAEFHVSNTKD